MKKLAGIIMAVALLSMNTAGLAEGAADQVNITYDVKNGIAGFQVTGMTAERYGNSCAITMRYQSDKDQYFSTLWPHGDITQDMLLVPAASSGEVTFDRTIDEITAYKSLTLYMVIADINSDTMTLSLPKLSDEVKSLRVKNQDSVAFPLDSRFQAKDISLEQLTATLAGDQYTFSLRYHFGSSKKIAFYDLPGGGPVQVYDKDRTFSGAGTYAFSVPAKNLGGITSLAINILNDGATQPKDMAYILNVRALARLGGDYKIIGVYPGMTPIGTALADGSGGYLVPLRAFWESRGSTVTWEDGTKTVHVLYNGSEICTYTVGSAISNLAGGNTVNLGGPVVLIGGMTYAPAAIFGGIKIDPYTLEIYTKPLKAAA